MELNGVANLHFLVDVLPQPRNQAETANIAKIKEQLVLLERYMLAYQDHKNSIKAGAYGALLVGVDEPQWHEIKANPTRYPTNAEKSKKHV